MTTTTLEIPVVELVHPLPGFPGQSRFALAQLDEDGVLCQLRSLTDPDLQFLAVRPAPFFPDYAPSLTADVVADLAASDAADVVVLLVLTVGESLETTTANLMAPVLVNTATHRASQVILDDPMLPVAATLVA